MAKLPKSHGKRKFGHTINLVQSDLQDHLTVFFICLILLLPNLHLRKICQLLSLPFTSIGTFWRQLGSFGNQSPRIQSLALEFAQQFGRCPIQGFRDSAHLCKTTDKSMFFPEYKKRWARAIRPFQCFSNH